MFVVFTRSNAKINTDLEGEHIYFPERDMSIEEQLKPFIRNDCDVLVTNSPFLLNQFKRQQVYVHDQNWISPIGFNPYGADISIIIKNLCKLNSLQSKVFLDDIKAKLNSPSEAIEYLESQVGDSMEKAYLLRQLRKAKEDAQ